MSKILVLTDGSHVTLRAIKADDGPMLQNFVRRLSARSRRFRFFSALAELSAAELERFVNVDRRRQLALVAITERPGYSTIVAEARCVLDDDANGAEFAVAVADEFQKRGLGTQLVRRLFTYASKKGVKRLFGEILANNGAMLALARRLGFRIRANIADPDTLIADVSPL